MTCCRLAAWAIHTSCDIKTSARKTMWSSPRLRHNCDCLPLSVNLLTQKISADRQSHGDHGQARHTTRLRFAGERESAICGDCCSQAGHDPQSRAECDANDTACNPG